MLRRLCVSCWSPSRDASDSSSNLLREMDVFFFTSCQCLDILVPSPGQYTSPAWDKMFKSANGLGSEEAGPRRRLLTAWGRRGDSLWCQKRTRCLGDVAVWRFVLLRNLCLRWDVCGSRCVRIKLSLRPSLKHLHWPALIGRSGHQMALCGQDLLPFTDFA